MGVIASSARTSKRFTPKGTETGVRPVGPTLNARTSKRFTPKGTETGRTSRGPTLNVHTSKRFTLKGTEMGRTSRGAYVKGTYIRGLQPKDSNGAYALSACYLF